MPRPRRSWSNAGLWLLATVLLWLAAWPGAPRPREDRGPGGAAQRPGLALRVTDDQVDLWRAPSYPEFRLAPGESIHPSVGARFVAEWSGSLQVPERGRYRFRTEGRLFLNGREVGDRGLTLAAGEVDLRLRFEREAASVATLELRWASDSWPEQPVPMTALRHRDTARLQLSASIERGRDLVERLRCFECHSSRLDTTRRRRAPDLTHVGRRARGAYLSRWLAQPRRLVSHATMPAMLQDEGECRDVATYLTALEEDLRDQAGVPAGAVIAEGEALFASVGCIACHDADRLPLDHLAGKTAVGPLTEFILDPGATHPDGTMPALFGGPGRDRDAEKVRARKIAWFLLREAPATTEPFQRGDPRRGEALVYSSGCLECHPFAPSVTQRRRALGDHADTPPPTATRPAAPPLERMILFGGCLDAAPRGTSPAYRLESWERDDLQAYLRWLRQHPERSVAPAHEFERAVEFLQCTACHEWRDQRPEPLFPDPAPALTDVVERRGPGFLEALLGEPRWRTRDGNGLRMPHFGAQDRALLRRGLAARPASPSLDLQPVFRDD